MKHFRLVRTGIQDPTQAQAEPSPFHNVSTYGDSDDYARIEVKQAKPNYRLAGVCFM